jgi:hypothetical protein
MASGSYSTASACYSVAMSEVVSVVGWRVALVETIVVVNATGTGLVVKSLAPLTMSN